MALGYIQDVDTECCISMRWENHRGVTGAVDGGGGDADVCSAVTLPHFLLEYPILRGSVTAAVCTQDIHIY